MTVLGSQLGPFEQQLQIQLQELIPTSGPGQKFSVALSGGADSTALLVAASRVLGAPNVRALHANHGLQSTSLEWTKHCQCLCEQLGVELVVGQLQLAKGNVEAAARRARYDFFAGQLKPNETLLLGHHSQDQLETVFMRVIQGRSLRPMRVSGRLGKGVFLRPLLVFARQQMLDYLNQQKIAWIEDPSNRDETLMRNFLRHRILPLLLSRWPSLAQAGQRVAAWQQGQEALLHELLQEKGDQVSFNELPNAGPSRRAWLRIFLELRGHYGVTDRALDEFWRQSHQGATSRLDLAADSALMGWRNSLYYEADMAVYAPLKEASPASLNAGEVTEFGGQHWLLERSDSHSADGFYSPGKLCLSTRRKGLSMRWRGRKADIKEVFRQLDVPPWRRATVPLVVWRDEVVAVSTLAINERFRDRPEGPADTIDYYRFVNVK